MEDRKKKQVNWGIIGTGWIADKFADGLSVLPGAKLKAVASRTAGRAKKFAAQHHIDHAYAAYEDIAHDPDVDVVYIATPHPYHCENTLMCLEQGKAVLCEKPFAMNEKEVSRMVAKARQENVFLMEAFWTRFLPSIESTLKLIASGTLGPVRHINSDFGVYRPFDAKGRLFNKDLGGGSLLDIGIYPVFLTLLLWGEPDEIGAVAEIGPTGVDESLALTFKYRDGRIATLFSSFTVNSTVESEICGTDGRIKLNRMWHCPVSLELTKGDRKARVIQPRYVGNGYNYEAVEVMKCLRLEKKESDILPLDFSLRLIRLLDRIRRQIGLVYDADNEE